LHEQVLDKPFLNNTDIAKLLGCSPSKASRIKRIIKGKLQEQGKQLVTNDIPTKLFVELMNLDAKNKYHFILYSTPSTTH